MRNNSADECINKLQRRNAESRIFASRVTTIAIGLSSAPCSTTPGPTLNFQKSQDLVTKIPRLDKKIPKLYWKYQKTAKMRTLKPIFTNIEKNILLRLHVDIMSELLTDWIQIWTSGDNVNSRSDYTIGLIVLDLRSQIIRCQNYTQNFILFMTVKNPKNARQNPQMPRWPQIPKILGKISSSGSDVHDHRMWSDHIRGPWGWTAKCHASFRVFWAIICYHWVELWRK